MRETESHRSTAAHWDLTEGVRVLFLQDGQIMRGRRTVTATSPDGRVVIEAALTSDGQYVATRVEFRGSLEQPVDAHERRISTLPVMESIAARTIEKVDVDEDGLVSETALSSAEAVAVARRRAPKRQLTAEFLRDSVAPIVAHCDANGLPYGPAIGAAFTVSPSTARNWVKALHELEAQS